MHQPITAEPVIKFYKLKNLEDIVAYELESTDENFYRVKRPLAFSVENEPESGRQMLNVREWIPPIVSAVEEILLPKAFVLFSTDVRDSFKEEFTDAVNYLYGVTPRKKSTASKSAKVVPFASILKDPSTKPN